MKNCIIISVAAVSLAAAVLAEDTKSPDGPSEPEFFPLPSAGGSPLPFSEAVRVGNMLFVSGQVGIMPGTANLAPGGIAPEAQRVLENIKGILERHGSSMDRVVKCTVFLADIKEWQAFNDVYREFFKTNLPARSALGANGLAFGARVEVECIAVVPKK
jgi:reactive intermediate/imine deaminase